MDIIRQKLLSDMGFSDKAIRILDQNLNMGTMKDPSITQQHQGSCGDILFLSLKISDNVIQDAMYEYIGCAGLQSCASALTEMIKNKLISEAKTFSVDDIIRFLEGIPEQKYECAEIAFNALQFAINKWENPGLKTI
jgi:NifU-like protein involved in Fe-S cluster formation